MEEKVIIDLAEFNRLKQIEKDISEAFYNKQFLIFGQRNYNSIGFRVINESEAFKLVGDEMIELRKQLEDAWAENYKLRNAIGERKRKWVFPIKFLKR